MKKIILILLLGFPSLMSVKNFSFCAYLSHVDFKTEEDFLGQLKQLSVVKGGSCYVFSVKNQLYVVAQDGYRIHAINITKKQANIFSSADCRLVPLSFNKEHLSELYDFFKTKTLLLEVNKKIIKKKYGNFYDRPSPKLSKALCEIKCDDNGQLWFLKKGSGSGICAYKIKLDDDEKLQLESNKFSYERYQRYNAGCKFYFAVNGLSNADLLSGYIAELISEGQFAYHCNFL